MNAVEHVERTKFPLDLLSWLILAVVLWSGVPYVGKLIELVLLQLYDFFFRRAPV